jgi:hypothetical protein
LRQRRVVVDAQVAIEEDDGGAHAAGSRAGFTRITRRAHNPPTLTAAMR